ncbi:MAG: hypothetical protein HC875_26690 [Anaerolineales bacterium]|nr:hypothetical protein [Anaerolineales bacterium]
MEINGNLLPAKLINLIENDLWELPEEKIYLDAIYPRLKNLELYGLGLMKIETEGLINHCHPTSELPELSNFFLGKADEQFPPGNIDLMKAILIGDLGLGSDTPIALDYREDKNNPSVLILHYFRLNNKTNTRWLKIANTFEEFWETIGTKYS